jgi:hypothetical protein
VNCRRRCTGSVHLAGSRNPIFSGIEGLLVETGHLGIRFMSLSQAQKSELQSWLSRKLEQILPEVVAGKFRK